LRFNKSRKQYATDSILQQSHTLVHDLSNRVDDVINRKTLHDHFLLKKRHISPMWCKLKRPGVRTWVCACAVCYLLRMYSN